MNKCIRFWILLVLSGVFAQGIAAGKEYRTIYGISYYSEPSDGYTKERCLLDLYYPANDSGFTTVIWFHGGGLTGGKKFIPDKLKDKGIAVVAVSYRLSPRAQNPAWLEDAAAAIA
jgi:acetyl esterase/lipase